MVSKFVANKESHVENILPSEEIVTPGIESTYFESPVNKLGSETGWEEEDGTTWVNIRLMREAGSVRRMFQWF